MIKAIGTTLAPGVCQQLESNYLSKANFLYTAVMSSRPIGSPPPYHPGSDYRSASYTPGREMYSGNSSRNMYKDNRDDLHNGDMRSHRTYSYFPPDEVRCETQHFYKWSSPPGVIKILLILIIVMCVGIFACIASTLPWDLDGYSGLALGMGGLGYGSMYGSGVSGFGGNNVGSYGSSGYGYGYGGIGGNYTDPRAAKGFILAIVALCFIFSIVLFVISLSNSRSQSFQTRKFYLVVIILCAFLGFLLLVATIVYIVAVNPTAQAAGTTFYNQLRALCGQFDSNNPASAGMFTNLYLYHYCVVDPQEAIAIVLGFLVVIALAIVIYFAAKVRCTILQYGKMNIIWDKPKEENADVEDWVNNVSGDPYEIPEVLSYTEKAGYPASEGYPQYARTEIPSRVNGTPQVPETEIPFREYSHSPQKVYNSDSDTKSAQMRPRSKLGQDRKPNTDNDTDYNTGAESFDELDEENLDSIYPAITSNQQRQAYKQEFDSGLQEYKQLQAEMDEISKSLSAVDSQLDSLVEGSSEYQAAAEEYNQLKGIKSSAEYKDKKRHCKNLKSKLAHIKQKVNDYDSQRL